MGEVHEGICGAHQSGIKMRWLVRRHGYYWPTIFKDAKKYVANCDDFQRMGKPTAIDEMPLQSQVVIKPFEKWALDFVGPINSMSRRKKTHISLHRLCNKMGINQGPVFN